MTLCGFYARHAKHSPRCNTKLRCTAMGDVVGILGGTLGRPWLTQLMVQVLSAAAPGTEYTALWLSNYCAVRACRPSQFAGIHKRKLPPNGGDLWVELQPGDVVDGPVEERVDGRGKRWLGTTLKL